MPVKRMDAMKAWVQGKYDARVRTRLDGGATEVPYGAGAEDTSTDAGAEVQSELFGRILSEESDPISSKSADRASCQ